jgi:hypothetical protein
MTLLEAKQEAETAVESSKEPESITIIPPSTEETFIRDTLKELWEAYEKKQEFDVCKIDFPVNWGSLVKRLLNVPSIILEAWPDKLLGFDEEGQPKVVRVRLRPHGLQQLRELQEKQKPGPKTNRTQITINGKEIDLRNRAWFDIVSAQIKDLEFVVANLLIQLTEEPTKRVQRACTCMLQRILLLRGRDLNRELYGAVCQVLDVEP